MNVHYKVELGNEEREVLRELIYRGSPRVRKVKRALILLGADQGRTHEEIARSVDVGTATVFRTKRDFVEQGLAQALEEAPRLGARRKLSDKEELLLVATACSDPPKGRARWTIELLADQMVRLTHHEHIGDETIRLRRGEEEVNLGERIDQLVLVARDHAAHRRDELTTPLLLLPRRLENGFERLALRRIDEAARVHDDHVGVLARRGALGAVRHQLGDGALGVDGVLVAA